MGRVTPTWPVSMVNAAFKASSSYIKNISGPELIPPTSMPPIDFSKDVIVIWVPGTNERFIPSPFTQQINKVFKNNTVVLADYVATWNFSESIPHGMLTLSALLDYIKKYKKKSTKVYVAGQSQGALIVGETLANKKYFDFVDRAVLFSHPGVAKHHYEGTPKVTEFNNQYDVTTFSLAESDEEKEKIIRAVDSFMTGDITKALYLLKVGITNPINAAWLGISSLRLLPIPLFKGIPAFHDVTKEDYALAARYLKDGFRH